MSDPNGYPFNNEGDRFENPEGEIGHTALDGTQIDVLDQSEPFQVDVDTSANNFSEESPEDALARLGYSEDNRAGEFDPRDQT